MAAWLVSRRLDVPGHLGHRRDDVALPALIGLERECTADQDMQHARLVGP